MTAVAALVDHTAGPSQLDVPNDAVRGGGEASVQAWFAEGGWLATDVLRAPLPAGTVLSGPAIVQASTTTVLLGPLEQLKVSGRGVLAIEVPGAGGRSVPRATTAGSPS